MIKFLSNIKIKSKFILIAIITTLGFIIFASFYQSTLKRVKVNGPIYDEIVLGKDLIADILPPPEYIIESYLVSLQLLQEKDPAQIEFLITRGNQLKQDYLDRHEFWLKNLEPCDMKKIMTEDSYKYAMDFFEKRDQLFIPAIKRNQYELAQQIALTSLKPAYEKHRHNIDIVVQLATSNNSKIEEESKDFVSDRQLLLILIGLIIIFMVVLLSLLFSSYFISRPLKNILTVIKKMASGYIGDRIDINRKDEIGDIASAMNDFSEKLSNSVIGSFNKISQGDLSFKIPSNDSQDQITPIINNLITSIKNLIIDLKVRTTSITSVSSTLYRISNEYSEMTSQISGSIQDVSNASESMHNAFKDISEQTVLAGKVTNDAQLKVDVSSATIK
jgi:methyl-accepting chemotaxis protein